MEAGAFRREFQKRSTEATEDVAALPVAVGETVVSAVKADGLKSEKLCEAVFNLQNSDRSAKEAGLNRAGGIS